MIKLLGVSSVLAILSGANGLIAAVNDGAIIDLMNKAAASKAAKSKRVSAKQKNLRKHENAKAKKDLLKANKALKKINVALKKAKKHSVAALNDKRSKAVTKLAEAKAVLALVKQGFTVNAAKAKLLADKVAVNTAPAAAAYAAGKTAADGAAALNLNPAVETVVPTPTLEADKKDDAAEARKVAGAAYASDTAPAAAVETAADAAAALNLNPAGTTAVETADATEEASDSKSDTSAATALEQAAAENNRIEKIQKAIRKVLGSDNNDLLQETLKEAEEALADEPGVAKYLNQIAPFISEMNAVYTEYAVMHDQDAALAEQNGVSAEEKTAATQRYITAAKAAREAGEQAYKDMNIEHAKVSDQNKQNKRPEEWQAINNALSYHIPEQWPENIQDLKDTSVQADVILRRVFLLHLRASRAFIAAEQAFNSAIKVFNATNNEHEAKKYKEELRSLKDKVWQLDRDFIRIKNDEFNMLQEIRLNLLSFDLMKMKTLSEAKAAYVEAFEDARAIKSALVVLKDRAWDEIIEAIALTQQKEEEKEEEEEEEEEDKPEDTALQINDQKYNELLHKANKYFYPLSLVNHVDYLDSSLPLDVLEYFEPSPLPWSTTETTQRSAMKKDVEKEAKVPKKITFSEKRLETPSEDPVANSE